jgi:hypothetical protein
VRKRHVAVAAIRRQRGQGSLAVRLADEDVQILGVTGDPGVPLERVGTTDQEWNAGRLQALEGAAVECSRLKIEILLGARR